MRISIEIFVVVNLSLSYIYDPTHTFIYIYICFSLFYVQLSNWYQQDQRSIKILFCRYIESANHTPNNCFSVKVSLIVIWQKYCWGFSPEVEAIVEFFCFLLLYWRDVGLPSSAIIGKKGESVHTACRFSEGLYLCGNNCEQLELRALGCTVGEEWELYIFMTLYDVIMLCTSDAWSLCTSGIRFSAEIVGEIQYMRLGYTSLGGRAPKYQPSIPTQISQICIHNSTTRNI